MNYKTTVIYSRILWISVLLMFQAMMTGCGADRALTLEDLSRREAAEGTAPEANFSTGQPPKDGADPGAGDSDAGNPGADRNGAAVPGSGAGSAQSDAPAEAPVLTVYVCGAVARSGVYRLPEEARICDALDAAGGMTPEAAEGYLNLAAPVTDGQELYFPTVEETSGRGFPGAEEKGSGGLVNINTADEAALQTLPGVGKTRAGAIISYREKNGGFRTAEDLMKVSGIGESTYETLKDFVTVGP